MDLETIERLAANIPALVNARHQLSSPWKLLPRGAITRLAEHDSLVTEDFPETIGAAEVGDMRTKKVAWRFAYPDVARVYRLLIRMRNQLFSPSASPLAHEEVLQAGFPPFRARVFERGVPFLHTFWLIVEEGEHAPADVPDTEIVGRITERAAELGLPSRSARETYKGTEFLQ